MNRDRHAATLPRIEQDVRRAIGLIRKVRLENLKTNTVAKLRRDLAAGRVRIGIKSDVVTAQIKAANNMQIHDMPAPAMTVRILIETVAQRWNGITLPEAWGLLGIPDSRGARFAKGADEITWPEWCMLWDASIGPADHTARKPPRPLTSPPKNPLAGPQAPSAVS